MKRLSMVMAGLVMAGLTGFACSQRRSGAEAGWITLLDGSNLNNWNSVGTANWRIADGVVQADKGSGHLVSKTPTAIFKSEPSSGLIPTPTAASSSVVPIPKKSPLQPATR